MHDKASKKRTKSQPLEESPEGSSKAKGERLRRLRNRNYSAQMIRHQTE